MISIRSVKTKVAGAALSARRDEVETRSAQHFYAAGHVPWWQWPHMARLRP